MLDIFFLNSFLFPTFLTIFVYVFWGFIQRKFKLIFLNPLLFSIISIILFMKCFNYSFEKYKLGGDFIMSFLGITTISLAVVVFREYKTIKKYLLVIFLGCFFAMLVSIFSVVILGKIFNVDYLIIKSLYTKSITSSFAIEINKIIDANVSLAVVSIVLVGILGNVLADVIFKVFKIKNKISKGISLGASSHVLGTAKAMELGSLEGSIASVSLVIAGLVMSLIIIPIYMVFLR